MIVRTVVVNRKRSAKEALDATGRKQYVLDKILETVSNAGTDEEEEVQICFWKISHYVTMEELEEEYQIRGQRQADFFEISAVNEAYPSFGDEKPNGTSWKDAKGNWCFAGFRCDDVVRQFVCVDECLAGGLGEDWYFAGVRKKNTVS
jgi:hypothetical protein